VTKEQELLLALIRKGIGQRNITVDSDNVCWNTIIELSRKHDVATIIVDGINKCYEDGTKLTFDRPTKLKLIGIANKIEIRYQHLLDGATQLAHYYQKHQIRMMIIKGYGLALDYPIPHHRSSSDVDIYLLGDQKKGDQLVHDELGLKIDNSHHHHTVFNYKGVTFENHYDFLNVHGHRSNKRVEKKLKSLVSVGFVKKDCFYFPSADFNAIFVLRHSAGNFASTEMCLRQALDWGFFIEKHEGEISWDDYLSFLKDEKMYGFYNLLSLFCIKYLGFDASKFHGIQEDSLLERFAAELLSPEFKEKEDGSLWKSLTIKSRRWWHNRWKNKLCYADSNLSNFVYGLWAKMLKPSHFIR